MQLISRCALLTILAVAGCTDGNSVSESPAEGSTGTEYFLPDSELERLEGLAKKGDATAAIRVADHYALGLNRPGDSMEWRRIAARSGSAVAMRDMASDLVLGKRTEADCSEAKMWIGKAEESTSAEEAVALELASVRSVVDQRCTSGN